MFLEELKTWAGVVALFLSIAGTIWAWLSSNSRENAKRIDEHETTLVDHDRRVQSLESELRHLPDKDSVNSLQLGLTELRGSVSTLAESFKAVERTAHRIEEFLLKSASEK